MSKDFRPIAAIVTCFIFSLPGTSTVYAQADEAESNILEEVLVTARKRDEALQDVPVAVSAISADDISENLAQDLTLLGELAPQVKIGEGGSGTGAVIGIRGVSSSSSDAGFDQSVLVEIDGVPFGRGTIIGTRLFDIADVQVLSGPQALYFGKNSPAGVISINSADPTQEFEAYIKGGYEFNADQAYSEGAISGGLTDTLSARFAFRASTQKGWTTNNAPVLNDIFGASEFTGGANPERMPASDEFAGRLTLLWEPTEDFTARLKFMFNSVEANSGNGNTEPYCIGDTLAANAPVLVGSVPLPNADCYADQQTSHAGGVAEYTRNMRFANGGDPYLDREFYFAALDLNKWFGDLSLDSTTGFYDGDVQLMNVTDWSPYGTIWASARYQYQLFTQELRLTSTWDGPINFMVGGYYEHSKRPFDNVPEIFHVYNPEADNYASADMTSVTTGDYFSFFAELVWAITPTLELSGGARWSRDERDMEQTNLSLSPAWRHLRPVGDTIYVGYDDDHVSPEVALTWRPTDDHTLYGAYKTGYKGGGISNPFLLDADTTPDELVFRPEIAEGFEVGYKSTALGGALRYDLNVYRYDYEDLQVVSADNSGVIQEFNLTNAGESRIEGIQASFAWLVTDELSLNGNLGLNDAKYTKHDTAQCYFGQTEAEGCIDGAQNLAGVHLIRAPELTLNIGGDWEPRLFDGWLTRFSASANYSDDYQATTDNAPGGVQDSFWLINAGITVGPEDGQWEIALLGRNLTDEYYMLQSFAWTAAGNPDQYTAFWNRPMEIALQGTYRF